MPEEKRETIEDVENRNSGGMLSEFWGFLMDNKKFWLLPIILVFMILGTLIILSGTGASTFIYTLF